MNDRWWPSLVDTIWPPRCVFCEDQLQCGAGVEAFCRRCASQLRWVPARSVRPETLQRGAPIYAFLQDTPQFFALLHRIKYARRPRFLPSLLDRWAAALLGCGGLREDTVLCPLPDDARRRAERGFSVTGLLAEGLAERLSLRLRVDLLYRRPGGFAQATISGTAARRANQQQRWGVGRLAEVARGSDICLVEDQITSGATVTAAMSLLGARGHRIACLSLARSFAAPEIVLA